MKIAAVGGSVLLIFLIANAFVSERNLQDIIAASEASRHTRNVLEALDGVWSAVQDAERGQRGYLLTGEEKYLRPYKSASAQVEKRLKALDELISDPNEKKRLDDLRDLTNEKMAEIEHTVDLNASGHHAEALNIVRADVGLRWSERIFEATQAMWSDEQSTLNRHRSSITTSWQRARATNIISTAVGAGLLAVLAVAFARQSRQSQQLKAQERRSEARFRRMTDSLPLIAWSYATDGSVALANQFFFDFTGKKPNAELSGAFRDSIHEGDRKRFDDRWKVAKASGLEFAMDLRFRNQLGEFRWFETRCVPFRNEKGEVEGWFGSAIDVHDGRLEQERLALAVEERTSELSNANRELEGFTYSVSHDLRAPLRAIASTSHILVEDFGSDLPKPGQELLRRQAAAATKLGRLIDDLLQLARLSRQEMHRERLEMSLLVAEIVDGLPDKDRAGHEFVIQPDLYASGDPRLVRFALENLIANAVKFSPEGGPVEFGETETPRGKAFFLRDHGVGFDMAYASKLFKPFERLVAESEFPGTGIGLTNVQRAIERHQGQVWAESELGKGATFYFTLCPPDK
ncbi:MAG TPA: CHASE3 domain-containing protein [Fimbriimonadaceae bacterium]|nr:CHASE3 domain-containing protein [Fimbriimonadaceae bacterium]